MQIADDIPQVLASLEEAVALLVRQEVEARQRGREALHQATRNQESFLLELIKVVDLLDQQVGFLERQGDEGPWRRLARNLSLARESLLTALAGQDVSRIVPNTGSTPDYRSCKAVERRPAQADQPETVDEVLQAGYARGAAILRMAEVAIRTPEA